MLITPAGEIEIFLDSNKMEHSVKTGICPKCGGTLVQRKGKYGDFVGCSNYAKCRYTMKQSIFC